MHACVSVLAAAPPPSSPVAAAAPPLAAPPLATMPPHLATTMHPSPNAAASRSTYAPGSISWAPPARPPALAALVLPCPAAPSCCTRLAVWPRFAIFLSSPTGLPHSSLLPPRSLAGATYTTERGEQAGRATRMATRSRPATTLEVGLGLSGGNTVPDRAATAPTQSACVGGGVPVSRAGWRGGGGSAPCSTHTPGSPRRLARRTRASVTRLPVRCVAAHC